MVRQLSKQTHKKTAMLLGVVVFLLLNTVACQRPTYFKHNGKIFGTYYNIQYEAQHDQHEVILTRLEAFDNSLSAFNKQSIISHINQGVCDTVDADFETMFRMAEKVYRCSHGAFDLTVAPLVGAWGFGFTQKETMTQIRVDSLLQYVGMDKVQLVGNQIIKPAGVLLDASAIAKGQACDVIAEVLQMAGAENYLVDIGGEIVCRGVNSRGEKWHVGITKPIDDTSGQTNEIQQVIETDGLAMATSGNYRQFYFDGEKKRSHTIDPRTGYPVAHGLLSATVIAPTCMEADALATACMVLGVEEAVKMLDSLPNTAYYLICDNENGMEIVENFGNQEIIRIFAR